MYKKVESELEAQRVQLDMEKKLRDSISLAKKTKKKIELKEKDSIAAKTGQK